jgi:PEP-CTERM motif
MKRTVIAAALVALAGAANAGAVWVPTTNVNLTQSFNNIAGLPTLPVGTALTIGDLWTTSPVTVTFTYLGQESSFSDKFHLLINGQNLLESDPVGSSVSAGSLGGYVNFSFEGDNGKFATNGGAKAPGTSIGLIGTNLTVTSGAAAGTYAFVLGYNDSAGTATLGDWDDFVVGVNIAPIPEPETYALMLAGLGVMGFIARRRRAD